MYAEVLETLEKDILTEENTDRLIDITVAFLPLPLWLKWLPLRGILDRLFPGVLLKAIKKLIAELEEKKAATNGEV